MSFTEREEIRDNHISEIEATRSDSNSEPVDPVVNSNEDHHFEGHDEKDGGEGGDTEVPQIAVNSILTDYPLFQNVKGNSKYDDRMDESFKHPFQISIAVENGFILTNVVEIFSFIGTKSAMHIDLVDCFCDERDGCEDSVVETDVPVIKDSLSGESTHKCVVGLRESEDDVLVEEVKNELTDSEIS